MIPSLKSSLKMRLMVYMMAISTMGTVLTSLLVYTQMRNQLGDEIYLRLETAASLQQQALERWMKDQIVFVNWLVTNEDFMKPTIQMLANHEDKQAYLLHRDEFLAQLDSLALLKKGWFDVLVLDSDGKVIYSSVTELLGDYRILDEFFVHAKRDQIYVQKTYPSPIDYRPTMTVSVKVGTPNTSSSGVLAINLNLDRMDTIVLELTGLGNSSESYLVDKFHTFLSSKRFGRNEYPRGAHSWAIDDGISGNDGMGLYLNYAGEPVIGVYRNIVPLDALLLVEIKQEAAFLPAQRLAFDIFIFGLVVLALLLCAAYYVATQITKPIVKMTQVAKGIAAGNLSMRVENTTKDEIGALATAFNDMTSRLQTLYKELSGARDEAQSATEAKSLFLANMSHEIRTPMNAIMGYTQLIQAHNDVAPELMEYVTQMESSEMYLLGLINSILDLSKIEAGLMTVESIECDLTHLIEDLDFMFGETSHKKYLQWHMEHNLDKETWIIADKTKLRQVLINLIGNAVKFTQLGKILLKVTALDNEAYQFEISDTGEGISEKELPFIFDRFQQADAGKKFGGTGLGLALSFEQIKLMGGELEVESQLGVGSTFSFKIHATKTQKPDLDLSRVSYSEIIGIEPAITVLIVDDIKVNRLILSKTLSQQGIRIITASNGLEAVTAVHENHIDIIYMDIRMPEMNGQEALTLIRSKNPARYIPCVAITAANLAHEYDEIMATGFDGFISKPFRFEEVYKFLVDNLDIKIQLSA
ncbi:MAG: signal transduction histidine kinase/CheY-like chemotaxis protein [Candidatus Azotimanducaceae bacterium]|jgi:signal transduction histidine kinase/CheY-like chemotaxis protein